MTAMQAKGRARAARVQAARSWAASVRAAPAEASRALVGIMILLLAGGGCGRLFGGKLTLSEERAIAEEVEAVFDESGRLLNAKNFEAAAGFYADDPRFLWIEDGGVRYTAPAQVAEALGQLRQFETVQFAYDSPRITVLSRDVAMLFTTYTTTLGSPESAFVFTGAMTITLFRTGSGWRFLQGHRSSFRQPSGQTETTLP